MLASTEKVKRSEELKHLAELLTARHLRNAMPDSAVRDVIAELRGEIDFPVELVEQDMHCIAIVGAGASALLLKRGGDLADELERQFGRDEVELERLQLVNNFPDDALETRLLALGNSREARQKVRKAIADMYNVRHPTLLGYELLAHLLKHRFIDAIISFNFDELLDQSLDDELDAAEYRTVISERDCRSIVTNPSDVNYVPLYVKLHGTASEPESLRFTPHSYYSIPDRISDLVRDLLHCEHCVITNIGSGLGSFDFQRLLGIPGQLEVFNLSRMPINAAVQRKIHKELRKARKAKYEKHQPDSAHRAELKKPIAWLHECNAWEEGCDELLQHLTDEIEDRTVVGAPGDLVQFRLVHRHTAVAQLLGADTVHAEWAATPEWLRQEQIDYCRRRTILELAFAGAKARGLLSLVPLTLDRPARYYERYCELTRGHGDGWASLCSAAGLVEADVPDILLSQGSLRARAAGGRSRIAETRRLHEFDAAKLAQHVLPRVKYPADDEDLKILEDTIRGLQTESDIELHMRDDRVCSKAFEHPETLVTATSLQAYTWLMLRNVKPDDKIYICSETGEWLLREPVLSMLKKHKRDRIQLLVAFDVEKPALKREYGSRIEQTVIDPWRHNRHMTIVCNGETPKSAIYFARRLRTPVVTAVYLNSIRDVERLLTLFRQRWNEAIEEQDRRRAQRRASGSS